jgi:cell division septation protein DedD
VAAVVTPAVRFYVLTLALIFMGVSGAASQTLDQVDRHLREGRLQDARTALLAWEAENPGPDRGDRQRGLWLRGLLTLDPDEASSSYAQLLVEYPGGPFTDRALLRLALAADLRGDSDEAAIHYAQLARDHPTSPLRVRAERWLRDHPDASEEAAVRATAYGGPETTAWSEGSGDPRPAADSVRGRRGEGDPPSAAGYTVQLGAFSERRWADDLASRAQAAGFETRIVRLQEDALVRVRIGLFETRAEAIAARDRVHAAGFDASLAADIRREREAG